MDQVGSDLADIIIDVIAVFGLPQTDRRAAHARTLHVIGVRRRPALEVLPFAERALVKPPPGTDALVKGQTRT